MKKSKNKKHFLFSPKYFIYDFIRITGAIPGLIWWRPKIIYENENAKQKLKGGVLVISNHLGFLDPVYLMYTFWYRRIHFITLKVLFDNKIKSFIFHQFQCIPIDRENFNMNTFHQIVGHLKNEEVVAMFPEGHINTQKERIQSFKAGMILMALQSGKPIVPVFIKKQKGFGERLVAVIGEKVQLQKDSMNMKVIENLTLDLYNREEKLREIFETNSELQI